MPLRCYCAVQSKNKNINIHEGQLAYVHSDQKCCMIFFLNIIYRFSNNVFTGGYVHIRARIFVHYALFNILYIIL